MEGDTSFLEKGDTSFYRKETQMRKYKRLNFWLNFISLFILPIFTFLTIGVFICIDKDQNGLSVFSLLTIFPPLFCYIIYLFIYRKIDKYLKTNFGKYNTFGCPVYVKMKFSNWIDIFNLNPDRWSFPEITLEDLETCVITVEYENNTKRIFIYFDFLDWLQFRHWYKHTYCSQVKFKQEQIKNKEEAKTLEIILLNAQSDIDKLRAQSKKEFNQGTKIIKEAIRYDN